MTRLSVRHVHVVRYTDLISLGKVDVDVLKHTLCRNSSSFSIGIVSTTPLDIFSCVVVSDVCPPVGRYHMPLAWF